MGLGHPEHGQKEKIPTEPCQNQPLSLFELVVNDLQPVTGKSEAVLRPRFAIIHPSGGAFLVETLR